MRALRFTGNRCAYCGESIDAETCNVDHVRPWRDFGRTKLGNLVAVCHGCNKAKGNMHELRWLVGLDRVYDERLQDRWLHAKRRAAVLDEIRDAARQNRQW